MNKFYKNFLLPTGLLSGTIIGAGVFALPFIFKTSGILTGFFYLFLGAGIYIFIHSLYADLIMRTEGEHRLVGLMEIYLGKRSKWLGIFMAVLEMLLVMAIYLVLSVSFIELIVPAATQTAEVLAFWSLGSLAIFLSVKRMAFLEFLVNWGMVLIIILIFVLGISKLEGLAAKDFYPNFSGFLLPLAPIFFALGGRVAIPSVVKYFRLPGVGHQYALVKKAIAFGTLIPALVYGFFVLGILGLSDVVSEDAVSGLIGQAPVTLLIGLGILGVLALWSSYIIVGLDIDDVLIYDLKISKLMRVATVVGAPLIVYFLSSQDFIGLVSFVGGIFLALEGILIITMWVRANKILATKSLVVPKINPLFIALSFLLFIIALVNELLNKFI